jgi:hypothetical protein
VGKGKGGVEHRTAKFLSHIVFGVNPRKDPEDEKMARTVQRGTAQRLSTASGGFDVADHLGRSSQEFSPLDYPHARPHEPSALYLGSRADPPRPSREQLPAAACCEALHDTATASSRLVWRITGGSRSGPRLPTSPPPTSRPSIYSHPRSGRAPPRYWGLGATRRQARKTPGSEPRSSSIRWARLCSTPSPGSRPFPDLSPAFPPFRSAVRSSRTPRTA